MDKKRIYLTSLFCATFASGLTGCVAVEQTPSSSVSNAPTIIEENIVVNKLEYTEELKSNSENLNGLNIVNSEDYSNIDILLDAYKNSSLKTGYIKSYSYKGEELELSNYMSFTPTSFWNVKVDEQLSVIEKDVDVWNQAIYDNGSDDVILNSLETTNSSGLDFLLNPDSCLLLVREITTDDNNLNSISCDYAYENGETGNIKFKVSSDRIIKSISKQNDNSLTPVIYEFVYDGEIVDGEDISADLNSLLVSYSFDIDNKNIDEFKSAYYKSLSTLNILNKSEFEAESKLLLDAYELSSNQYGIVKVYEDKIKQYDMLYDKTSVWVIDVDDWWSFSEYKNNVWERRILMNGEYDEQNDTLYVNYDSGLDFILYPDLHNYTITSSSTDEDGNTYIVCKYQVEKASGYEKFKISSDGLIRHIYNQPDNSNTSSTYEFSYKGEENFDGNLSDLLATGFKINNPKVDEIEKVYEKTSTK